MLFCPDEIEFYVPVNIVFHWCIIVLMAVFTKEYVIKELQKSLLRIDQMCLLLVVPNNNWRWNLPFRTQVHSKHVEENNILYLNLTILYKCYIYKIYLIKHYPKRFIYVIHIYKHIYINIYILYIMWLVFDTVDLPTMKIARTCLINGKFFYRLYC